MDKKVSSSVLRRMPRYYRYLRELKGQGVTKISSNALAKSLGVTASQIRQDLNCFGGFGQQGYGYNIANLVTQISHILELDRPKKMIVIGAGNLGSAIANYSNFKNYNFEIVKLYDNNLDIVGKKIGDISVDHIDNMEKFVVDNNIKITALCVPKSSASGVLKVLEKLGIEGIWNFSYMELKSEHIIIENVHLSDSLVMLSYRLGKKV